MNTQLSGAELRARLLSNEPTDQTHLLWKQWRLQPGADPSAILEMEPPLTSALNDIAQARTPAEVAAGTEGKVADIAALQSQVTDRLAPQRSSLAIRVATELGLVQVADHRSTAPPLSQKEQVYLKLRSQGIPDATALQAVKEAVGSPFARSLERKIGAVANNDAHRTLRTYQLGVLEPRRYVQSVAAGLRELERHRRMRIFLLGMYGVDETVLLNFPDNQIARMTAETMRLSNLPNPSPTFERFARWIDGSDWEVLMAAMGKNGYNFETGLGRAGLRARFRAPYNMVLRASLASEGADRIVVSAATVDEAAAETANGAGEASQPPSDKVELVSAETLALVQQHLQYDDIVMAALVRRVAGSVANAAGIITQYTEQGYVEAVDEQTLRRLCEIPVDVPPTQGQWVRFGAIVKRENALPNDVLAALAAVMKEQDPAVLEKLVLPARLSTQHAIELYLDKQLAGQVYRQLKAARTPPAYRPMPITGTTF